MLLYFSLKKKNGFIFLQQKFECLHNLGKIVGTYIMYRYNYTGRFFFNFVKTVEILEKRTTF